MPHEKAVSIIIEGRGSHFDPDMVDAFVELQEEFRAIAKRYADSDQDMEKKKEQLDRLAGSGS
jgi:putative two-component system response regulator